MKLCQKCIDSCKNAGLGPWSEHSTRDLKIVPESYCEFWAHQRLRIAISELRVYANGDAHSKEYLEALLKVLTT